MAGSGWAALKSWPSLRKVSALPMGVRGKMRIHRPNTRPPNTISHRGQQPALRAKAKKSRHDGHQQGQAAQGAEHAAGDEHLQEPAA